MTPAEIKEERRAVLAMLADLETVGGRALVQRLLANFADRLTELLDPAAGAQRWTPGDAHALAGIAGMLGFGRLAAVGRDGMHHEQLGPPSEVIDAAMAALAITAALLSRCERE